MSLLWTVLALAQGTTIELPARDAFERGTGASAVREDEARQGVVLYDRLLVEDDGPGIRAYKVNDWYKLPNPEVVQPEGETRAKKILRIDRIPAMEARLYGVRGATVEVNGRRVTDRAGTYVVVPPSFLRAGDNEVVLSGGGTLVVAARADILVNAPERKDRPPRSFRSADGGKTWQAVEGEFLVRLHLIQYAPEGSLTSPVLYLGDSTGKIPGIAESFRVESVVAEARAETSARTSATLSLRTGATAVYEPSSWSDWSADARLGDLPAGHRYAQWKASLKTSDPSATPVLEAVTLRAGVRRVTPAWAAQLTSHGVLNAEIRYTSMPFAYETSDHPRLVELRKKHKLDEVVAGARTEFEALVKLRDWVSRQWKYNPPIAYYPAWDAHDILEHKTGFCVQYAIVYVQCCLALGHQARFFYGNHPGIPGSGHEIADVWSNDYQKWVHMDANVSVHHVDPRTKEPLGLLEVQERMIRAVYGDREVRPENIDPRPGESPEIRTCYGLSLDPHAPKTGRTDWPRWWKWLHVRYVPRNDWFSRPQPLPYTQGHTWNWPDYWVWEGPRIPKTYLYRHYTARRSDLEWTINQVAFDATPGEEPGTVSLQMGTVTPNFDTFLVKVDGKGWKASGARAEWRLHDGTNKAEMRVRNTSGVVGPVSALELRWTRPQEKRP